MRPTMKSILPTNLFNRYYNEYVPIGTHPTLKPSGRTLFVVALLIVSLVFNIVTIIRRFKIPVVPLDDFQDL